MRPNYRALQEEFRLLACRVASVNIFARQRGAPYVTLWAAGSRSHAAGHPVRRHPRSPACPVSRTTMSTSDHDFAPDVARVASIGSDSENRADLGESVLSLDDVSTD